MLRLHITAGELWLPVCNALPFGNDECDAEPTWEPSPMRNLLIIPIILILAATGCQSLRRIEVWKQQKLFSSSAQPVAIQVPGTSPCPQVPCQPAAPAWTPCDPAAATAVPNTVQSPIVSETVSQGETVLPGPAENVDIGPIEEGPAF